MNSFSIFVLIFMVILNIIVLGIVLSESKGILAYLAWIFFTIFQSLITIGFFCYGNRYTNYLFFLNSLYWFAQVFPRIKGGGDYSDYKDPYMF